ncbi:MAG: hypothetical protein AD073_000230 [Mycoplasmataceae bacterium]|nr:MAG: hypothetical protein AD073_000230 [Mycoplasmataceae bacterium]
MINNDERRNFIVKNFSDKSRILNSSEIKERSLTKNHYFFRFEGSRIGCGDAIDFLIVKEGDIIKKVFFSNQEACIVSISATNIICSWLEKQDRSFSQTNNLIMNIRKMLAHEIYDLQDCKEMEVFKDINSFSNRTECLNLVIKSFDQIIRN